MNCDKYCLGKDEEPDCLSKSAADEKSECIKSCMDCRSPNKKYCYCPKIFPGAGGANSRLSEESELGSEEESFGDDKGLWVILAFLVLILLILLCLCWYWWKLKGRRGTEESEQPVYKAPVPEQREREPSPYVGYDYPKKQKKRRRREEADEQQPEVTKSVAPEPVPSAALSLSQKPPPSSQLLTQEVLEDGCDEECEVCATECEDENDDEDCVECDSSTMRIYDMC